MVKESRFYVLEKKRKTYFYNVYFPAEYGIKVN